MLATKYAKELDKSNPLPDYPRPQLKRDSYISLNGYWDYATVIGTAAPIFERKILVPFPPESPISEICEAPQKNSYIYYRRTVTIPDGFIKDRLLIHFGAGWCEGC